MKIIDKTRFCNSKRTVRSVRLSEEEIEAIELYRRHRWIRDSTDLTWGAALREILYSYQWETVGL